MLLRKTVNQGGQISPKIGQRSLDTTPCQTAALHFTAKGLFVPQATRFFFKMPAAALVMCIGRQRVVYAPTKRWT